MKNSSKNLSGEGTGWRKLSCLLLVDAQKIVAVDNERFLGRVARIIDDGHAALFAEGQIGQNDLVFAVLAGQRVLGDDRHLGRVP